MHVKDVNDYYLNYDQCLALLQSIVKECKNDEPFHNIGILTTLNRNCWAEVYRHLLKGI